MFDSPMPAAIESYSDDVRRNKIRCELPPCCICNIPPTFFTLHQRRFRKFRILHEMLVHVLSCLVVRWKCPGCKKTFTQQPPFALPLKRYTRQTILDASGCYVEDAASTYREVVLEKGLKILYASDGRILVHSTPYRWITTLGGFKEILRGAQDLVMQKDPMSTVSRDLAAFEISPKKYVKAVRRWVLNRCRQLIHLEAKYRVAFDASIFPTFATVCAWR
jgi:hypothetical protein